MDKNDISKIILGSGSYDKIKKGNTVSITGDGGASWGYFGPAYKKLAPKLETYLPYAENLKELNRLKENLFDFKKYEQYRKEIEDEYIKGHTKNYILVKAPKSKYKENEIACLKIIKQKENYLIGG